jgi:TolA-binding protein
MSSPELHADDLLDREIRGTLTSEERLRLREHLAVCAVCRFERAVRADFKAEFAAQSLPRDDEAEHESKLEIRRIGASSRRIRLRLMGLVAAMLLLGSVAAAELSGNGLFAYLGRSPAPILQVRPAPSALEPVKRKRVRPAASTAATPAASSAEPEATPSAEPASEASASSASVAPASAAKAEPHLPPASASALFDEAREAREQGEYTLAMQRYESLLALFPSSPQASTTHAVLGRLLLDRGDPAAALGHFDAYLSSGATTLGEEAMLGRALAFGKLGQGVQEAKAWRALLERYPSSLHAARATERLRTLGAE